MSQPATQNGNQSTPSTKKSILIRPSNESDILDFIYIGKYKAGKKFRNALARLSREYNFSVSDYKRGRIGITLDFAGFEEKQEAKNV